MTRAKSRRTSGRTVRASGRAPRNRRRPNYGFLFCAFLISAIISAGASFALQAPNLAIKEVKIDGVELAEAGVEKVAQRALGVNLLLLPKSRIAEGILRLSEVEDVKIGRRLPDSIWIRVRERKPAAVVCDSECFLLVDGQGFAYHCVEGPVAGVPLVRVPPCNELRVGCTLDSGCPGYALEALRCAETLCLEVGKISVDPEGDICLNMDSGFYVKLGQPNDIAEKMSLLRSALVCKPSIARDAAYIDLSCPSAPVWRPKSTRIAS